MPEGFTAVRQHPGRDGTMLRWSVYRGRSLPATYEDLVRNYIGEVMSLDISDTRWIFRPPGVQKVPVYPSQTLAVEALLAHVAARAEGERRS